MSDSPINSIYQENSDLDSRNDSGELFSSDTNSQEPENFFFESDHLALRGNSDYQNLLRAYILITAQKDAMLKQYDTLNSALALAQDKPLEFVKDFRSGKIKIPERIKPINIPKIDLEKYENKVPDSLLAKAKNIYTSCKNDEIVKEMTSSQQLSQNLKSSDKSHKLWTVAEQRRLEELLVEYPPEDVEMRRFAKIAKALGNRTTKQVASRLQKYFLKLHKAGLPVPGRLPRTRAGRSRGKHSVFNGSYSLMRPSTFFPTLNIPSGLHTLKNQDMKNVIPQQTSNENSSDLSNFMDDEITESESNSEESEIDYDVIESQNSINERLVYRLIKRVYKDKLKDELRSDCSIHIGYTCDYCKENPISGTRWHCMDCSEKSIDFCSDCLITQTETIISENNKIAKNHSLHHNIVPFRSKDHEEITDTLKTISRDNESIDNDDVLYFTQEIESGYIQYLSEKFNDKNITSQDFLRELKGLNLGYCDLKIIGEENVISQVNAKDFLNDKIVRNVFRSSDFFEKILDNVDGRLLDENLVEILKSYTEPKSVEVKKELVDHDYSGMVCDVQRDVKQENVSDEEEEVDCVNLDQVSLSDLELSQSSLSYQFIDGSDFIDIGREEFV